MSAVLYKMLQIKPLTCTRCDHGLFHKTAIILIKQKKDKLPLNQLIIKYRVV